MFQKSTRIPVKNLYNSPLGTHKIKQNILGPTRYLGLTDTKNSNTSELQFQKKGRAAEDKFIQKKVRNQPKISLQMLFGPLEDKLSFCCTSF